jgi:hypothetical protein
LDQIFICRSHKFPKKENVYPDDKLIKRVQGDTSGYIYYVYTNESGSTKFQETINMSNVKGLDPCAPYDSFNCQVECNPQ